MRREEWDALSDDDKPGIRFCSRVANQPVQMIPTAVIRSCAWCDSPIWFDEAQELSAEVVKCGSISVCENCALSHPRIAPSVIRDLADVYEHWMDTGVIKAIRIGEEES